MSLLRGDGSILRNNVTEGVAASPLAAATAMIPLHGVRRREVVPRANQVDGADGRVRLAKQGVSSKLSAMV